MHNSVSTKKCYTGLRVFLKMCCIGNETSWKITNSNSQLRTLKYVLNADYILSLVDTLKKNSPRALSTTFHLIFLKSKSTITLLPRMYNDKKFLSELRFREKVLRKMSFMASPRRTTVYLLHLLQKPQINHKMGQSVQEWTKYIFNRLSSAKFT